jgi:hypothetical protein
MDTTHWHCVENIIDKRDCAWLISSFVVGQNLEIGAFRGVAEGRGIHYYSFTPAAE